MGDVLTFEVPGHAMPLLIDWFEHKASDYREALGTCGELERVDTGRYVGYAGGIVAQLRERGAVDLPDDDPITGLTAFFRDGICGDCGAMPAAWDRERWADLSALVDVMAALDATEEEPAG